MAKKHIILLILWGLIFTGCAKQKKPEFQTDLQSKIYRELSKDIKDPALKNIIKDERFKIYELQKKKKTYDTVPGNYFKNSKFGLLTPAGRKKGREFLTKNRAYLDQAAERFGLHPDSAEIITGLAGIEYSWGRLNPPYKLFNALVSVYHTVPSRKKYAVKNIKGLLAGIRNPKIEIDPYAPSSFMGAVGYCQLMPFWFTAITTGGYEKLLDLDDDGVFDPFKMPDTIAFFGWYMNNRNYNMHKKKAVGDYAGSGSTARAFAEAVIEFADSITD